MPRFARSLNPTNGQAYPRSPRRSAPFRCRMSQAPPFFAPHFARNACQKAASFSCDSLSSCNVSVVQNTPLKQGQLSACNGTKWACRFLASVDHRFGSRLQFRRQMGVISRVRGRDWSCCLEHGTWLSVLSEGHPSAPRKSAAKGPLMSLAAARLLLTGSPRGKVRAVTEEVQASPAWTPVTDAPKRALKAQKAGRDGVRSALAGAAFLLTRWRSSTTSKPCSL